EREGRSLLDVPLVERLGILRTLPIAPPLRLALQRELNDRDEPLVAALEREFVAARDRGNEGLMVKDPRSPYRPGRRGMEWLKVKRALRTLDAVVTAVEWGHGKRKGVLSDYTFAVRDGDRLRNVGKAYSGLTDKEIAEMTEHFLATTIKDLGRLRIDKVLGRIVETATRMLDAERATLYVVDAAKNELWSRVLTEGTEPGVTEVREIRVSLDGRSLAAEAARSGLVMRIDEPYEDP